MQFWLRALKDLNPRHPVLETDVLPTELKTHSMLAITAIRSQLYYTAAFFYIYLAAFEALDFLAEPLIKLSLALIGRSKRCLILVALPTRSRK